MRLPKLEYRHKHLIAYVKENKFRLSVGMICMLVVAVTTSASVYLLKPVLDDIFVSKDPRMLMAIPLAIVFIFFLRGVGMYGQEFFMEAVGQRIIRNLRNDLYDRIMDLSLSFFYKERTGVLMSRITNDVNVIKAMVSTAVTGTLKDCTTILCLTGLIFYLDWQLALIAFIVLPAAFFPIIALGRRVRHASTGVQQAMAELSAFLHETFSGNRIVKAFGMESHEKQRFFQKTKILLDLEIRSVVARSLSSPVMEFLGGIGIALVLWYGGYRVFKGVSTVGTFVAFIGAVVSLYDPVKKLSKLNNALQEGLAAVDRIYDIIERKTEIISPENPAMIQRCSHRVTFEQVSFKYENEYVLNDIDLDVAPGEILALVGASGGGKTSLVNLIPRFYDVSQGAIRIDGVDIRHVSLPDLRQQIAIVTQDPILFNETVGNNIAYGNPKASMEDIQQAAKAAFAYEFIQQFPDKFDTSIGELGSRLSGGEKQRICIARALLKDAPILILDEATSSLDAESEQLVQKALENLMASRTTFIIAHRLATIGYAHRIVVISNGRIVEQGNHKDLIALKGEYYKLHQMQFTQAQK